jgi:hypothetical protein
MIGKVNIECGRCKKVIGKEFNVKLDGGLWDVKREYNQPWKYDYEKEEFVCMECNTKDPAKEEVFINN